MKKIFNKIFCIVFLCSIVMPIALFSGVIEWLFPKPTKRDYSLLFNIISEKSAGSLVDEDTARRIFESGPVQGFMPKWYSVRTKIGFMDDFINYSRGRFITESRVDKELFAEFCKIVHMASTYRGYLKRPFITRKDVALIGIGAGTVVVAPSVLRRLKVDLMILAAFKGAAWFVLERLNRYREKAILFELWKSFN